MSKVKALLLGTLAVLMSTSYQQTVPSFNVNMDIDIETGDYMVNTASTYKFSVFTNRVDAGTTVSIRVPYMLTVLGTSGQPISSCQETAFVATTNTMTNTTLTNCIYTQQIGYQEITFQVSKTYTGITLFYFFVGQIRNPSSVMYPDSFQVSFSGGFPTGTQNNGLILTYEPNKLREAALTHSRKQAGTIDTYVFSFKLTNDIPRGGFLKLSFPSPWTAAPINILSLTTIRIYGQDKTGFTVVTPLSDSVTYAGLFDLVGVSPSVDPSKKLEITITGIENPNQIIDSGSFTITTLDDSKNPIDEVSSGLVVSITDPGTITMNSFIVGDKTVGQETFIQMDLNPSAQYSKGGYIEIVTPLGYISLTTTLVCNTVYGLLGTATCTRVNDNTLRYSRGISSSSAISMNFYNFINALGVVQNPPFEIYLKESTGNIVSMTKTALQYTTVAGACTLISAVRGIGQLLVGATNAQYSLSFKCMNRIPVVGKIQIVLPDEMVGFSSTMTCQDTTGTINLNCNPTKGVNSTNSQPITTVTINANVLCSNTDGCAKDQVLSVQLLATKNPNYINNPLTTSVSISTFNTINGQQLLVDQLVKGVSFANDLQPGTLTQPSVVRGGSSLTGGVPTYTFSVKTATPIPSGAGVRVTFPTDTVFFDGSSPVTCKIGATSTSCISIASTIDPTQVSKVTLSNTCTGTTDCPIGTVITFTITGFLNPFSTQPNPNLSFKVETFRSPSSGGLIDQVLFDASTPLTLLPNLITATLTQPLTPIVVGDITSYSIQLLNTFNKLPSATLGGKLTIGFPQEVRLLSNICQAQTSSITLTCLGDITTQTVTVTSLSQDLPKGTSITVLFPENVKSPQTGALSSGFIINTYFRTSFQIDTSSSLKVRPDTFNDLINVNSQRDAEKVNLNIKLTLSFTSTNPLPQGTEIRVSIPTDQAVTNGLGLGINLQNGMVAVKTGLASATGVSTFAVTWCAPPLAAGCTTQTTNQIILEVTQGFKNPANARFASSSIKIETYTSAGDKIDAISSGLITVPSCNQGKLQSVSITRSSQVVGQQTSITFNFKTAASPDGDLAAGQGYVNVRFPVGFLYRKGTGVSVCSIRETISPTAISTSCVIQHATDTLGQEYAVRFIADLKCTTASPCTGGKTYELVIDGYLNPFSTRSRDGLILSTSTTKQSTIIDSNYEIINVLDQIIGTTLILPPYVPGTLTLNSLTRTVTTVDSSTNLVLEVKLMNRLEKGGLVTVKIPKSQVVQGAGLIQYQSFSGTSFGAAQTLSIQDQTADHSIVQFKEFCAVGTAKFCPENTVMKVQIIGFVNIGSVQNTPVTFFQVGTWTADGEEQVDQIDGASLSPQLTPADIQIVGITLSTNQAAVKGVTVDFALKFGARVRTGESLTITISDEFFRQDNGDLTCFLVSPSNQEIQRPCVITHQINVVKTITIADLCTTSICDATNQYILRVKNAVNKFTADAYTGTLLIQTKDSSGNLIGTVTKQMSTQQNLIPGVLSNVSVIRSSTTQGLSSEFTIMFSTPGYLLDDAIIELSLPENQITLATGKTDYKFKTGTISLQFQKPATQPLTKYLTYTAQEWLCVGVSAGYCEPGLSFTLTLSDAANPFVQSTSYSDFIIQIKSAIIGAVQFKSSSPLVAIPELEFGKVEEIGIAHQNSQYVMRPTEYVFNFTVKTSVPMGGKIKIIFPLKRVVQGTGTLTCKVDGVAMPCTITFPTNLEPFVLIPGICPTTQCEAPITKSILLSGGIKNPATVPVQIITGNFIIQTLSADNFIVSQGLMENQKVSQVQPEPFTTYGVTRLSPYMAAPTDYRITFKTINIVPAGGFFRVILPNDQVFTPTMGPTCKADVSMASLVCRVVFKTTKDVWVDISSSCSSTSGCPVGTNIAILFQGLSNPNFFSANTVESSWSIYTMNKDKEYIDGLATGIKAKPDLLGKTSVISAISVEHPFVGRETFLKIGIIAGSDMTTEAVYDIYFPGQFAFERINDACSTVIGGRSFFTCTYEKSTVGGYISKVTLNKPCPLGCLESTAYYFDIPITLRGDVQSQPGSWRVIVRYPFIDVGMGSLVNTLTIQPDFLTRYYIGSMGSLVIDGDATLYISFKPNNYIPKESERGRIRLIIPPQIRVMVQMCNVKLDGNALSGAKCTLRNNLMTISHQYATSLVNRNITIEIKSIANPASTKPTDPIQIFTEWDPKGTGTYYLIDQNIADINYRVTGLTKLLEATVTRLPLNDVQSGYLTGQPTQLVLTIMLRHQLESTSSIIVKFPESAQATISATASKSSSCYTLDFSGKPLTQLLCEVNKTTSTVTIRNYCQVSSCGVRDQLRVKLLETYIQNYNQIVSPLDEKRDALTVTTTTKEGIYFIDTASVMITPEMKPSSLIMPSPEVIRTNNIINRRVSWVFSFKTNKNPIPKGGYMNITIPKDVLITFPNSTLDILNYDNGVRYWNMSTKLYPTKSTQDIESVREIIVWNLCNKTDGCQVGSSFSFQIDWIRNPLSQIDVTQPIVIDMRTQQGYLVERGTTQPVIKLFSELIPARLQHLDIRIHDPTPSAITDYDFIFSADAEFSSSNFMFIQLPQDFSFNLAKGRLLQSSMTRCTSLFNLSAKINCTVVQNSLGKRLRIDGLFSDNSKQYGVRIRQVTNSISVGPSQALLIEIKNIANQTIAQRSIQSRVTILQAFNQSECNQVCGECAGTNSTCTKCATPSKYPLFKDQKCVDSCGSGYFFDQLNLRCIQCSHTCESCHGAGDTRCLKCAENYFMQDGKCVPTCSKTLKENPIARACVSSYRERCSSSCQTCSLDPNYCLSCNQSSSLSIYDPSTGKCLPANDQSQCGQGLQNMKVNRFYIDNTGMECKICSELCKTCENNPFKCTQCWNGEDKFQSRNAVNELYETCVDRCGLGTYYDKPNNTCRYCNPVCLTCSGQRPDQCQACNKTPEARQLYLYETTKCVISCPKGYSIDKQRNSCHKEEVQIVSFSFLFLFSSVAFGTIVILGSIIITKCRNKTLDIIYAVISVVEFVSRICLLGNLFVKSELTGVFPLSVCFMNQVATSSLGLFFNLLFMTPIYAHSPHFRVLLRQHHRGAYRFVEWMSYLGGVNVMRLLCSGFFGAKAYNSDLNNQKYFMIPLNLMANYTLLFTMSQLALDIFVILFLAVSDDAFVLAGMGLGLNTLLAILQLFKHLTTTRQFSDDSVTQLDQKEEQQQEADQVSRLSMPSKEANKQE